MKFDFEIGETVYGITLKGCEKGWGIIETKIDKIIITKSGVSYHLQNNSPVGGSYIYYKGKPIFKNKADAEAFAKQANEREDYKRYYL